MPETELNPEAEPVEAKLRNVVSQAQPPRMPEAEPVEAGAKNIVPTGSITIPNPKRRFNPKITIAHKKGRDNITAFKKIRFYILIMKRPLPCSII